MPLNVFLLIVGLALIVKSADILINSSTALAAKLKIPIFIVGIVIVAFGTSAPELVIGIMSGISNTNELTLGNIIGSGFSNIALILGISAVIMPLATEKSVVKKEIPMLIGVELLLFGLLIFDNKLSLVDGIIMILCFVAFMTYIIIKTKMEQEDNNLCSVESSADGQSVQASQMTSTDEQSEIVKASIDEQSEIVKASENEQSEIVKASIDEQSEIVGTAEDKPSKSKAVDPKQERWIKIIPLLILSLAGLFIGGKLTVDYSSAIALAIGLSESFIGITVVAIATTLPELVASIAAVRKKEAGIVLGNCIGSNIFNILLVAGASSMLNTIIFDTSLIVDFCLLIALTLFVFFVALFKKQISRKMGIVLVSCYALYFTYKILSITALAAFL